MPQQLEQADIGGATIAIVKDGKLLFAKGYGYSDYRRKAQVSAQNFTRIRPGSNYQVIPGLRSCTAGWNGQTASWIARRQ